MSLPPWDPDEADREVRALRKAEQRERGPLRKPETRSLVNTIHYDRRPRGDATPTELARRKAAERAMRNRAARRNPKGEN